jgi:ribosome recycling factor
MSTSEVKKSAEERMGKSIDSLKTGLAKIRTGRAHAGILDHVLVEYYGSPVPVSQVANVNLIDARNISVQVWEKSMAGPVEKAIRESDLGLNPIAMGDNIRLDRGTPPRSHQGGSHRRRGCKDRRAEFAARRQ